MLISIAIIGVINVEMCHYIKFYVTKFLCEYSFTGLHG